MVIDRRRFGPARGALLCVALAVGTRAAAVVSSTISENRRVGVTDTRFQTLDPPVDRDVDSQIGRVVERFVESTVARLALMHDVARWKWNAGRPIDDPDREQALADALVAQWSERGLDEPFLRRLLQAQFDAAKMVQRSDFAAWSSEPDQRFDGVPDLATVQRPRIERATRELLEAIVALRAIEANADGPTRNRLAKRLRQEFQRARTRFVEYADALDKAAALWKSAGGE